jgi:hypothetical protein
MHSLYPVRTTVSTETRSGKNISGDAPRQFGAEFKRFRDRRLHHQEMNSELKRKIGLTIDHSINKLLNASRSELNIGLQSENETEGDCKAENALNSHTGSNILDTAQSRDFCARGCTAPGGSRMWQIQNEEHG